MIKFLILLMFVFQGCCAEETLTSAYHNYTQGMVAQQIIEKSDDFNAALLAYSRKEKELSPGGMLYGKLMYNIANAYFQLQQYPWAVLYYHRALKEMPRDVRARKNLTVALQQLGLSTAENKKPLFPFSTAEQLRCFLFIAIAFFVAASFFIWTERRWIRNCAIILAILGLPLLGNLAYLRYLSSIEGVVIESSYVFREAQEGALPISTNPLLAGTKVQVLEVIGEGEWLKILNPDQLPGYIPYEKLMLI